MTSSVELRFSRTRTATTKETFVTLAVTTTAVTTAAVTTAATTGGDDCFSDHTGSDN